MIDVTRYLRFGRVMSVSDTERGLLAEVHGERLRIDLVRDEVVRFKISRGTTFDESPSFAVGVDPLSEPVTFTIERSESVVRLRTGAIVVSLGLDPFRLDVHRLDGTPVVETASDEHGEPWAYATLNDAFTVRRRCRPGDAIYGLGEKSGRLNRAGRDFTLWNTDVLSPEASAEFTAGREPEDPRADRTSTEFDPYYVSIPFFYHQDSESGGMSGSFIDNGYRGHYEFSHGGEYRIHFAGGQYTEYVFAGPGMREILAAYTWLTGRASLPPLWSLGYHQSRWFAYTQAAVEQMARRHRESRIPCDALWLDIEHMDGYRVFTWDDRLFPDVGAMVGTLTALGFRLVTIVDPGVKYEPGYWVFDQARERDVLCRTQGGDLFVGQVWPGNTAFPDFVTEEARTWWGRLNADHARSGVAGIWNDMNEPATGAIPPGAMRFDHGRRPHERYHNQYALLMAMATRAGLLDFQPRLRPFVLTRAGCAGIQRYAANWMGDNLSRWDHLWMSMPMAMGFGVSGQPFVGADIAGFAGHANAELFVRWMQYGTLSPFCRNHSEIGNVDQYAWSWGDAVEDLVRDAIRLRYRLLPYLYAAFVNAAEAGAPVQRPLVFDYQYDAAVRELDDEYLLGGDLLVAPVAAAGCTARQVYLPAGCWYDWHTGEAFDGGRFVIAPTPMDRIPVYARGGAVIPMWPDAPPSTAGYHPSEIELHLFVPAADGRHLSLLQEDDGVTFDALDGTCLRTTFELTREGSRLTLRADVEGDGYPEHAREGFSLVVHGAGPEVVRLDGREVQRSGGRFWLPNTGSGFTVEVDVG